MSVHPSTQSDLWNPAERVPLAGAHAGRIEDALLVRAHRSGTSAALISGSTSWTYAELAAQAGRFAAALGAAGAAPGDRVAIYLDKTLASVVAIYGTWLAGGIVVPVNETLHARQLRHIVHHSDSRVLVSDARKLTRLNRAVPDGVTLLTPMVDAPEHSPAAPPSLEGGAEPAAILYTSGSTGLPKGILISHDALAAGTRIVSSYLGIDERDRLLSVLPFSFDYGLNQLLTSVACGATLVLQRSMLPADICRSLVEHAITGLAGVPPLWLQLMQSHSPLPGLSPQPRLRYMTNSGGALPVDLVRRYQELWPDTRIYLMYGLSEAFRSTYLPPEELDRRPDSIGRAIPETEIHVVAADGRPCGPGEVGELVHRGPTVALGYWKDPGATAAVFRPSPFPGSAAGERAVYSGDFVRKDDEGYLYFVGRRDLLIKSQGYRISPDEVEAIIYASGLAAEVVVQGRPDDVAGQIVVAHVVPGEPETFRLDHLRDYCQREMPAYMVPRTIHVHPSLPRTATGKLDRAGITA